MATMLPGRDEVSLDELAEEMELHILEKAEDFERGGMTQKEAMQAARRAFGDKLRFQEDSASVWHSSFWTTLLFDLRSAIAQLRRAPYFSLLAVLLIALAIGTNTASIAVLYTVTIKSLPVQRPRDLVFVSLTGPRIQRRVTGSHHVYSRSFVDGLRTRSLALLDGAQNGLLYQIILQQLLVGQPNSSRATTLRCLAWNLP